MNGELDITILDPHWQQLRSLLEVGQGHEASAYLKLGVSVIAADPWTRLPRTRLVSHSFLEVAEPDRISSSPLHVTWSTRGYMRLLSEAMSVDLIPAIVHTHPGGSAFFSEQDDANEAELARTARLKGTRGLASIVLGGDGSVAGRIWLPSGEIAVAQSIRSVGGRVQSWSSSKPADDAPHLDRQARLFGDSFNAQVRALRVAVVGCGGTGSAAALLLARLGIGHVLLIDKDTLDETNLNRVHGSRRSDATSPTNKVDISEREILAAGLGTRVAKVVGWAGEPELRDGLKSCDFIFGCTDDHSGRLLLNRLAYFYGIPVIDVGLRMRPVAGGHDIFGRVTTLVPGHPCLLCRKVINARRAGEESLERSDPAEFHKRKQEAYVMGAGDPAPAVVTFTTEMACVAVDELIAALTGFHGKDGMIPNRARRFHARDDRFLAVAQLPGCPVCSQEHYWGRATSSRSLMSSGDPMPTILIRLLRKLHLLSFDFLVVTRTTYPDARHVRPGEIVVVQDGAIRKWACLLCPGGCGALLSLSLNHTRRPSWSIEWDFWRRPSIEPSIHQTTLCQCHFWIKKGCVRWAFSKR